MSSLSSLELFCCNRELECYPKGVNQESTKPIDVTLHITGWYRYTPATFEDPHEEEFEFLRCCFSVDDTIVEYEEHEFFQKYDLILWDTEVELEIISDPLNFNFGKYLTASLKYATFTPIQKVLPDYEH